MTRVLAEGPTNHGLIPGRGRKCVQTDPGHTQLLTEGVPVYLSPAVKRPGYEFDHSPLFSEANNPWVYSSVPIHAFIDCTGMTFRLVYSKVHRYFAAANTILFEATSLLVDFCILLSVHNYSCLVGIDLELLLLS